MLVRRRKASDLQDNSWMEGVRSLAGNVMQIKKR